MEKRGEKEEEGNQNSKLTCERQRAEWEERETELAELLRLHRSGESSRWWRPVIWVQIYSSELGRLIGQ